jgi:hypothetical protein
VYSWIDLKRRRTLEFSRAELRRLKAHALLNFCPAQTMITELCFVFQNAFYRIAKRATEEAQEASAAMTCSLAARIIRLPHFAVS